MDSKTSTFRHVIGYALFALYGLGGLITIGLVVTGQKEAAGIALLCVLAGSSIPLFLRLVLHFSRK
jgi:hypothetical protein